MTAILDGAAHDTTTAPAPTAASRRLPRRRLRPRRSPLRRQRPPGLERLGGFTVRRRAGILVLTLLALIAAAAVGSGAIDRLKTGGFTDPAAESSQASALLEENFGGGEPNYLLLITARGSVVDDPVVVDAATDVTAELATADGVERVVSYWDSGSPPSLRSTDGEAALVLVRLAGDEDQVKTTAGELSERFTGQTDALLIEAGGSGEVYRQVGETAEQDLVRADAVAFPLTFLALIVVFGAVVAAALPVGIGAVAVVGTLLVLAAVTGLTDVSVFSLNLTTALGLGLAIDYSLFIVARFREELERGRNPKQAVVVTVATAGRTVIFSAVTVALSLAALLVFPLYFLRSFAYAGIPVVLMAATAATVVLPALLAVLGRRIEVLRVRRPPGADGLRAAKHARARPSRWGRVARLSSRHPWPVMTASIAILLALGAPFLGVTFGLTDDRNLPRDAPAAQVHDDLRERFDARESEPVAIVSPDATDADDLVAYAGTLSGLDAVARVDTAAGSFVDGRQVTGAGPATEALGAGEGTWVSVVPGVEPLSEQGEALVREIRALDAPVDVLVGGSAARLVDTKSAIAGALPWALLIIVGSVGTLLFAFTGGLLIPVKAIVVNVLSLSATFGVLVWGFQDGGLSGLLGDFAVTGTTDLAMPVLMFCVAFGLSMDYEVFLLSRMREEWERTGDNTAAVVAGIERTGGIVTSAAALVSIVFLSFATSGITSLKMLGIGLTVAVLVDTTLVRGFLVPAAMQLAGPANWWAPGPLRRLHDRFGLREAPEPAPVGQVVDAPTRPTPDPAELAWWRDRLAAASPEVRQALLPLLKQR